jgi:pimeloyl-ACP methyl ester carboxylesterase
MVIYQHGWFRDRTEVLFMADALSFAGFAAVAIDMPFHGITDTANPFYMKGLERTFDLDLVDNTTGAAGPDGQIDTPSGRYFVNLQNMLTTRDNFRETAQDLRQLTATLPLVDLDGDRQSDVDAGRIHFVGHSMGAITGGVFLGIERSVTSATLGMGGGGLARMMDGSPRYEPILSAALATQGIIKGTSAYDNYLSAAQTVLDSGDGINYGSAAASLHPIHLIEVVGGPDVLPDQNVPNSVENAPLAGTEALAKVMGLQSAGHTVVNDAGVRAIVRFTQGDHYSFWYPVAAVGATAEMQGQMIRFLETAGKELEIIYKPVIQH